MALVDYYSQDEINYSTTVTTSGRPNINVMESGEIRGAVYIGEDSARLRVFHTPVTKEERNRVRAWVHNNRNNNIRITASDGRVYIGTLERDGAPTKFVGTGSKGEQYFEIYFDLLVGINRKPTTVIDVVAQVIANLRLQFIWARPEIRSGTFWRYLIQWRINNSDWSSTRQRYIENQDTLSATFSGNSGDIWQFRMRTELTDRETVSDWSANATATVVRTPPAVANFARQIINDVSLLTWDALADKSGFLGYEVEERLDGGDWTVLGTTLAEQFSRNMFDTRGSRHEWRVRARSRVGYGAYSNVLEYVHPLNPPFTVGTRDNPIIINNPKSYENVEVSSLLRRLGFGLENGTFFRFRVPTNEREDRYRILMRGAPGSSNWNIAEADGDPIATGSSINEQLTFNVVPGANYDFVVFPYDLAATRTVQSLRLTIIDFVQDVPHQISLRADNVSQLRIPISWNTPDDNQSALIEYQIQISTNPREFWTTVSSGRLATQVTVTEFTRNEADGPIQIMANSLYYFRGRTRNGIGWSDWSRTIQVRTPNFSTLEGRWELGISGITPGIVTQFVHEYTDEVVQIPRGTGVAQFILESYGGYNPSQIKMNVQINPGSSIALETRDPPGGFAAASTSFRGNLYHFQSDIEVVLGLTQSGLRGEGQISHIAIPVRDPTNQVFTRISFTCQNPSGASHFEGES